MDRSFDPDELLLVGRVLRAHGVRGEMKLLPETDDPERFADLETIYLGPRPETAEAWPVTSVRFQQSKKGTLVVVRLEGVETPEDVAALRGRAVYALAADLPPLAEDEVFLHDLIGLAVATESGEAVGEVKDVLQMPAHDTLLVARDTLPDVMIPAVPEFIVAVDLEAERIVIRPIEGLLA